MAQDMLQITEDEGDRVTWRNDVEEFENPETLIGYLESDAPDGSYRIDGFNVWATQEAIDAAVKSYNEDCANA